MRKILVVVFVLMSGASAFGQLPQNHSWEVTLRNYIASLTVSDYAVPIKQLTWNSSWVKSDDQLYRWWLAFRDLPNGKEIEMDPKYLLLSSIEGNDGKIHMAIGRGEYSVFHAAWWADFDYPGNPYYNNKAVKLRAMIPAMVDLMMITQAHENGQYERSDYAGGDLMTSAYAFYVGQDVLPDNVKSAWVTGMKNLKSQIQNWGPTGIFGDMDSFAIIGMWYLSKALNDPNITQGAQDYTDRLIERWFNHAGYMGHGDGFDATYDGIDLYFYSWAAMISNYQPLIDALNGILKLKGFLTVPDPDGYWNGPSHFSTATNGPVASDQWNRYLRDVSDAMLSDNALYLLEGNGVNRNFGYEIIPDVSYMESTGSNTGIPRIINSGYRSTGFTPFKVLDNSYIPKVWHENHWINDQTSLIYAYDGYKTGFYKAIKDLKSSNSTSLIPPFSRKTNFISVFSNNVNNPDSCTFLAAKLGGFGAIIHTGRLSNWGDATGILSGLSGGTLSTFWTPTTGTVINGIAGGYQNNNSNQQDSWSNWQEWSVNAISGLNGNDKPFSSARNRFPEAISQVNGSNTAELTVNGKIGSFIDGGQNSSQWGYTRESSVCTTI